MAKTETKPDDKLTARQENLRSFSALLSKLLNENRTRPDFVAQLEKLNQYHKLSL